LIFVAARVASGAGPDGNGGAADGCGAAVPEVQALNPTTSAVTAAAQTFPRMAAILAAPG
jgi:hypothetical protein